MRSPVQFPPPDWVISDTHFGHANILDYCPWRKTWATSIRDHDQALIAAWRERVKTSDVVLHLGDFALGSTEYMAEIRRSLPGKIIIIRGNHDRSAASMIAAGFDHVSSIAIIEHGVRRWMCRHNPSKFTDTEAAESVRLLHGHCHGNGLDAGISSTVRSLARDCSLDAVQSVGPVRWDAIA
jgi:calcineurin-like phosphoesterase family protein